MTEPKKTALASISEDLYPRRDDRIDALSSGLLQQSPWHVRNTDIANASIVGIPLLDDKGKFHNDRWESNQIQRLKLTGFKKLYTKVRTDNLALTHEAAIELVKMVQREADQITYEDTQ